MRDQMLAWMRKAAVKFSSKGPKFIQGEVASAYPEPF